MSGRSTDTPATPGLGSASFDDLLREVLDRARAARDVRERWELLLEAVVTMGADLTLDGLLQRIVEIASNLAGASYAALGVLDDRGEGPDGRSLRTFVTHGLPEHQKAEIGDLPTGHGILGLIIDRPEPLRLQDLHQHPASFGFPAGHPPMRSFLGVPIRIRDRVFGNLYLTEKRGAADFTEQDERIVVALAAAAGVAIERARLSEETALRERWLEATAEIARRLSGAAPRLDAMQILADRARVLARADVSWVVAGADPDELRLEALSGAAVDIDEVAELALVGVLAENVVTSGEADVIADLRSDARVGRSAEIPGWPDLGPGVVVPMAVGGQVSGVLALAWLPEHAAQAAVLTSDLPSAFAGQAALVLQASQSNVDRQRQALLEDRVRIGRDLHDLVIQRLFALGLGLQGAARATDVPELAQRIEAAVDDLDTTIREIRQSIFALATADQAREDIQSEVMRMVDRAACTLKFRPTLRFEGPVRTCISAEVTPELLAVLGEALSNAARHANASSVLVVLRAAESITLTVRDDGRGMTEDVVARGFSMMRRRAELLGGSCTITSAPGSGMTLVWDVPLG